MTNQDIKKSINLISILTYIFMVAAVILYFIAFKLPSNGNLHVSSETQLHNLKYFTLYTYILMVSFGFGFLNLGMIYFLKKEQYLVHKTCKILLFFLLAQGCELGSVLIAHVYYLYSNSKLALGIMMLITIFTIFIIGSKLKAHLKSF